MQIGMHLPHAGSQATPALIKRHAQRAEALGLSDVWVSEHIIVPRAQFPRSPLFYDPILTLTWVASVTERVRLGTSVIVLPMRHPLPLAKELSTLHNLSGGRLILGVGVGWLEPIRRIGVPFNERGRRMNEGIAMMRAVWSQDPVIRGQGHPGRDPGHDDAAAADQPYPDVARQPHRGGAPAHRQDRRRLARQPSEPDASD
jgi:alkanesulfonate monooxygenase SsuD/methylene tetrahydromethanopterin reductase-like flavin-dependent oxidoreductase (luciferase family)